MSTTFYLLIVTSETLKSNKRVLSCLTVFVDNKTQCWGLYATSINILRKIKPVSTDKLPGRFTQPHTRV